MSAVAQLETELAGLYTSPPEPLPFAPSLRARAFLLRREAGNLLVYSNDGLRTSAVALHEVGGVRRQYLNHWHVLVPWAATAGTPSYVLTGAADARRRIDAIIDRVRRGGSG